MTSLATTTAKINVQRPAMAHTRSSLLDSIAAYLDSDGATVEPSSIDEHGLTVIVGVMRYRLELDEGEVMDAAEYEQQPDDWDEHLGYRNRRPRV